MPFPDAPTSTEIEILSLELDRVQSMIDHARKTSLGRFQPVRAYLNNRQHKLDVQRIRVDAAKQYLASKE